MKTPGGWTLVEVVVALLLLTVGGLALAGSATHAHAARERALRSALALTAAESWIETWRAGPWVAGPETGAAPAAWGVVIGSVEWTVGRVAPCLSEARVRVVAGIRKPVVATLVTRRFRESVAGC
ncbi:MAG: hypothetical protein KAI97_06630 [Gemmatimonadetes bacterium]|nr:hypothetical protein [Gemmatimonadota bacterium]